MIDIDLLKNNLEVDSSLISSLIGVSNVYKIDQNSKNFRRLYLLNFTVDLLVEKYQIQSSFLLNVLNESEENKESLLDLIVRKASEEEILKFVKSI